jgi:tetratricopeptide (TPR) repeat protein
MSTPTPTRRLDPDALASLEEERDFLLRSLDDLEREHDAGDVDEHDYATLKDDYTARAARAIRSIEAHGATVAAATPPRSIPRLLTVAAGVVLFAVLAGVVVAQASGRRDSGDELTGNIRETTRTQLDRALVAASEQRYDEAIEIYDGMLEEQPRHAEALAYKGWFQFLSGDEGAGVVTLIDAVEADPELPDPHAFLAVAFYRLGRPETALRELDRLDQLDPPPDVRALTDGLRDRIEADLDLATGDGGGADPG